MREKKMCVGRGHEKERRNVRNGKEKKGGKCEEKLHKQEKGDVRERKKRTKVGRWEGEVTKKKRKEM